MFASRNLSRHCLRNRVWSLTSLLQSDSYRNPILTIKDASSNLIRNDGMQLSSSPEDKCSSFPFTSLRYHPFNGWSRAMSTSKGRSMRSKVERRMRKESGKTLREIRRAKKLKKKLMTDEERLIYNLKRAKKKVALLLQKLKKYELPDLPPPVHDPELFTPEQLQAYKKIGFKNKNYVPVGVRGVFGGVVQNMHLHWKFHETVQVCCDNFPKEKIKEMATMLARLSGGIVINIHNVKTIIMFRGRNYRQPKNLIPINTLTKRKALFKARFEQALESQKLNIKKIEQQLRRMGVNPEDPVAMASIQRVASTFFNAIDKKEGSPYVFHGGKQLEEEPSTDTQDTERADDSDQEELDRFIAEIEDAADKEWEAEEAAEKEEYGKIRYWNREDFTGRSRGFDTQTYGESNHSFERTRVGKETDTCSSRRRSSDSDDDGEWDSDYAEGDDDEDEEDDEILSKFDRLRPNTGKRVNFKRSGGDIRPKDIEYVSESENVLSDFEKAMWDSDEEDEPKAKLSREDLRGCYRSSSSEEDDAVRWELDDEGNRAASKSGGESFRNNGAREQKEKLKRGKERDEDWDSD